jgi:hypothetical protein
MSARQSIDVVGAGITGAVAGFVTRPCCIGPALLSLAGVSSAGLGAILATYHMLFVSLGAVMLIASMWITFRRDGGWFNKMLTASATVIAFSWSMGRMGVL